MSKQLLKQSIIDKYVELTDDDDFTVSKIVSYRSVIGWYFKINCGPLGDAKREELTYYAVALGKEDGYGWRRCTDKEERIARITDDHEFTREDPGTIGHVSFDLTPELVEIVNEVAGDFYIRWTPDYFWVEFKR